MNAAVVFATVSRPATNGPGQAQEDQVARRDQIGIALVRSMMFVDQVTVLGPALGPGRVILGDHPSAELRDALFRVAIARGP